MDGIRAFWWWFSLTILNHWAIWPVSVLKRHGLQARPMRKRVGVLLGTTERLGRRMHNFRTLLLAVLFFAPSSPTFAQDPGSWPGAPGQTTVQMQQSGWPSPGRDRDSYRRSYGYSGPDYTCPQPSVVVDMPGVPPDNLQAPAPSRQRENDPPRREITSAANASPAVAAPASGDSVPVQASGATNPP